MGKGCFTIAFDASQGLGCQFQVNAAPPVLFSQTTAAAHGYVPVLESSKVKYSHALHHLIYTIYAVY